ncbi:MAG: hypothetical protein AB7G39_10230 [Alphaproteobacteria bacterium]
MSLHRYPLHALRGDLAGSALGIALAGGSLLAARPGWAGTLLLGGLAVLFAGFLARTVARLRQAVELAPDALRLTGPGIRRAIPWTAVEAVALRYFATRRDRSGGWLALSVRGAGTTIRIESQIDGFETILARVAEAARATGAAMTEDTAGNLSALGILPPGAATEMR